jgi:uncharacterized membrane protein
MNIVSKRLATAVLILAAVADVTTTIIGIEYAGLSEFNALVAPLMDSYGYVALVPLSVWFIAVALIGAWVIQHRSSEYGKVGGVAAIYCCAAVKLLAAGWNSYLIASVSFS